MKAITSFFMLALATGSSFAQNTYPYPSTGNVGIGTTSPASRLTLGSNVTVNPNTTGNEILYSALTFQNYNGADYVVSKISSIMEKGAYSDFGGLAFSTGAGGTSEKMRINGNGQVGIGTTNPQARLHVEDGSISSNFQVIRAFQVNPVGGMATFGNGASTTFGSMTNMGPMPIGSIWSSLTGGGSGTTDYNGCLVFGTKNQADTDPVERMRIRYDGNVGIGAANPDEKLTVAGKIHSREVKVTVNAGADFVFDKAYSLRPLAEVEKFVTENKHLPEIAPAAEMEKNGLLLGEMNIKLLQKIEELTLYLIQKDKELAEQRAGQATQKELIEALEQRLKKLENKQAN